jgi:hypothetical protein
MERLNAVLIACSTFVCTIFRKMKVNTESIENFAFQFA